MADASTYQLKVGNQYFYSSGKYSEIKPDYIWNYEGENYIHVVEQGEPTISLDPGDPYEDDVVIPYTTTTIGLKNNKKFHLCGSKNMYRHVGYVSKREAREFISNGSISVNGEKVTDLEYIVSKESALYKKFIIVRRGKKKYHIGIYK